MTYIDGKILDSFSVKCAGKNCNTVFVDDDLIYYTEDGEWLCSRCAGNNKTLKSFILHDVNGYNDLDDEEKSKTDAIPKNQLEYPYEDTLLYIESNEVPLIDANIRQSRFWR